MDDPFYGRALSKRKFYGVKGNTYHEGCEPHVWMEEGKEKRSTLPTVATEILIFRESKLPEAALLLPHNNGTLITCDAVQNSTLGFGDPQNSTLATLFCFPMGFLGEAVIGPGFRALNRKEGAAFDSFVNDFKRMVQLPFKNLIPGHGVPLVNKRSRSYCSIRSTHFRRQSAVRRQILLCVLNTAVPSRRCLSVCRSNVRPVGGCPE